MKRQRPPGQILTGQIALGLILLGLILLGLILLGLILLGRVQSGVAPVACPVPEPRLGPRGCGAPATGT